MRRTSISQGGQVSIPAEVRRRWGTRSLLLDDLGDAIVLRPIPADPIRAAGGSLARRGPARAEIRRAEREAEAEAEQRKYGR
jgi:bifunctional DNA-binding transcriptional regulator/antitoxin component of YhaV-PrlF toxin-antitoxin module